MSNLVPMPRKSAQKDAKGVPKKDGHKPSYQCRIPGVFVEPLEKLATLLGEEVPDVVRAAVREYLQKHKLWPRSMDVAENEQ